MRCCRWQFFCAPFFFFPLRLSALLFCPLFPFPLLSSFLASHPVPPSHSFPSRLRFLHPHQPCRPSIPCRRHTPPRTLLLLEPSSACFPAAPPSHAPTSWVMLKTVHARHALGSPSSLSPLLPPATLRAINRSHFMPDTRPLPPLALLPFPLLQRRLASIGFCVALREHAVRRARAEQRGLRGLPARGARRKRKRGVA